MAIRTLPSEERYSNNKSRGGGGGGTEPRRKLKKLRSVKVANLDRLRLSMRREKTRFVPGSSSSESSSSSSSPMSGTYSPNYMRATTSSSARKASSSRTPERRNSPSSRGKSSSKLSEVSVEQCSDPAGVNIPVDIRLGKRLKRAPSMKRSNKLSSMKSMKIRAKYSQFSDVGVSEFEDNGNASYDQDGMIKVEPKKKGLLERSLSRSRSIRLMRLKSIRSSRRQKSRFGGATMQNSYGAGNSNAEPHYMKATSSQEVRKYSAKGLTRTSSLMPLRILAKIPSLRPRRSKVRKRPEVTPLPGVNIHRATCSSVLKSSKFPDHIQVNAGGLESEGFSSLHVCPYNYCSLHARQHHAPSPPLKEFISAKRQLVNNQKGKQLENHSREEVIHSKSVKEIHHLERTVDTESPAAKEVINARISNYQGEEDTGMDCLINVYAKPRKKWEMGGTPREDAEALNNSDHTDLNFGGYEWKLEDILGGTSRPQAREEALTEGKLTFTNSNIKSSDKTQQQTIEFEVSDSSVKLPDSGLKSSLVDKTLEPFIEAKTQSFLKDHSHSLSTNSESSSGDLTNILSDKQKYSSIWHLIYQQFVPSEESMSKDQETRGIGEREQGGDASTVQEMNDLELRESKHLTNLEKDEDNQGSSMEKTDIDQTAAINLVQEALNAILQREEMPNSPPGEQMEQVGEANEWKMPGQKMSKNLSKLRKIIVTAKFIKAMEKLKKISPGKPRFLLPEPTSEEERVYLRRLSMNDRKYDEEWMLDFALRKVISRLAPDQQRTVGLLVEAFETFGPENKEKDVKCYPEKGETAPAIEVVTSIGEEPEQLIELKQGVSMSEEQVPKKRDDGVPVYLKGAPEDKILREDHWYEASATGDKILQEADETSISSESPRNSYTTSIDRGFEEASMGSEERMRTPKVVPQFQTGDLAVYPAGDMVMVLFDKQKYSSMWNMIYQQVVSNEASTEVKQGVNGLDEKDEGCNVNTCNDDLDSTPSSYSTDHEEDEDNRSVSREKQELSKSAAIKLVKEAVNAILQRYELSSDQQSINNHNTASDNVEELAIRTPTNSNEENFREASKRMDEKNTHPEGKVLEKTSDASQKQAEANESKEPPKKMSKSLSKLRKAIVTAKFIKAMEKLRKINPQKPRHLFPEAASEEERVNLRNLSMHGRKNSEEWMLDYALRKVVTKLAPDQQRRVALLVEAFETVTPEQKEKGIRLANPTNKEPKEFIGSEKQRSIFDEQVLRKQDDGFLPFSEGIPKQRGLREDHDHQASTTDEKTQQETGKTAVSSSSLESTENSSKSACVDVTHEELSTGDEEMTTTSEVSSQSPTGDSDIGIAGNMTSILSDKTKYNSMWHLIYQHVVPSEASRAGNHGDNEIDEDGQGGDANNAQEMNDLDATVGSESTNQEDESNHSAECKEHELDQSAAIKLVKEAINTILQCSEPEDRLHKELNENAPAQKKVEASDVKTSERDSPKSFSKLKKLFITVKFMKAMERMRRISPRKPPYLSPEPASEEERVRLRHQDINQRRNAEEWMLDYALRKVISNLAPEQQRRVALLVEAFHTITPEQKGTSTRSYMKAEVAPAIELSSTPSEKQTTQSEHNYSTSYDDHIHPNAGGQSSLLGEVIQLERSRREEHLTEISNFKTKLHEDVLDSSTKGCPVDDPINALRETKERDSNSKSEPLQAASLSKDSKQGCEANITKGIFSDTQKHTSMWGLIYQHAKSVTVAEVGNSPSEIVASKDQLGSGGASSEMTVDGDTDDSDASSVTSELGESDAVKLVREAINDILAVPQELDNRLLSSNITAASDEDQRAGSGEKTLSRGYSKLRKLIICNKFIKAMEKAKMRKSYPQKRKNQILNADPEAEKAILKPCAVGDTKNTGELMLDRALQKVIEELAPVQQRRVALLVEAFEKVNPDVEETGKRFSNTGTESLSSASNPTENKDPGRGPGDFDLKLQGSVTISGREVATDSAEEETDKEETPVICKEDWRNNSPSSIRAATSDGNETPSNVCKVPTDVNSRDIPVCHIQQEQLTSVDVNHSEPAGETAEKPSQPEDLLEDEGNPSKKNDISMDKVRHTSIWRLLVQHVKSDILEESETQVTGDPDANARVDGAHELLGRDTDDSAEVNDDEDMNVQMSRSASFEIQEKEAIKVVQEALDEILTCDDSTTSDQDGCTENHGFRGEVPSPATEEIEGVQTLVDSVANPKEEQALAKEGLSNTYSKLSKVILCKRFIKAMDKMRKLKAESPQDHSQTIQSEENNVHPMRQTASNQRKNWEEWMLDHAMQQVVGKLAPVQKKKVSLLVQAFEKVSSQPEPTTGNKGKATGL